MYTRCLFCQADLGRNEAIEAFPVGRRLAYDAERGRLWVVCRSCERWNLTPLEQRWEAIDSAERLYRDTRRRAATENIGLAQLNDGTELVRVGRPLRPEFAAWRYGDQFGRRRRRAMATGVAAVGATGAVIVAGPVLGLVSLATVAPLLNVLNLTINGWRVRQSIAVPTEPGRTLRVATNLASVRLLPRGDERWQLEVGGVLPEGERIAHWRRVDLETRSVLLEGDAALRAAGTLLAHVNRAGGGAAAVRDAVALVERTPDPASLFAHTAGEQRRRFYARSWQFGEDGRITTFPPAVRLALEMAAHEEQERRALEGELGELERAWQEAEQIAAIADDLLLPPSVADRLRRLRGAG
jgi:hypothetical protein